MSVGPPRGLSGSIMELGNAEIVPPCDDRQTFARRTVLLLHRKRVFSPSLKRRRLNTKASSDNTPASFISAGNSFSNFSCHLSPAFSLATSTNAIAFMPSMPNSSYHSFSISTAGRLSSQWIAENGAIRSFGCRMSVVGAPGISHFNLMMFETRTRDEVRGSPRSTKISSGSPLLIRRLRGARRIPGVRSSVLCSLRCGHRGHYVFFAAEVITADNQDIRDDDVPFV